MRPVVLAAALLGAIALPLAGAAHELDLSLGDVVVLQGGLAEASSPAAAAVGEPVLSWRAQVARFLGLGLEHIFTGYDHVVFVLGLLLLGGTLRGVVGVVTSFTAAHSVTLALASLQLVRLPASIVEPLIAGSIVCIAVENLLELRRPCSARAAAPAARRTAARRWRLGFAFGLVHGFGFAGALAELDLSSAGLATALVAFNSGVELGQAAIVACAFPLLALLRRWPAPALLTLRVGSAAIGAAGLFWLVERLPSPRYFA